MPKFLTTTHISAELVNLIRSAKDEIVIISPYVKVNDLLQSDIDLANARNVRFTIIYGKTEMRSQEHAWIDRLTTQETGFISNLHAKCYLNESAAIVTSMNLYEFSQQNNDEMGILATRADDPELYQQVYEEARRLGSKANLKWGTQTTPTQTPTSQPTPPTADQRSLRRRASGLMQIPIKKPVVSGLVGRSLHPVVKDPSNSTANAPYAAIATGSGARFRNREFSEKFCHKWGGPVSTTFAKPLCDDCFSL